ncbi:hypothetical protein ACFXBB_06875 [Streptomyces scopuliridis]|uniref:hypothetical protein n=1 Tax=Streptomyces scopuliridis TaxID=452529 RepID=UPI0036A3341D
MNPHSKALIFNRGASMLTFEALLNVKLDPLNSAAEDWSEMIKKLKQLADDADDMGSYARGAVWKGENATVTKPFVVRISSEFQDAVTEAESICNILKAAHLEIKAAKSELVEIYENPPAGITISPDGVLSHRVHPDRRGAENTDPVVTQAEFDALLKKIETILNRAAEADETCAWTLNDLAKNTREFSSTHYGSLKDAGAAAKEAQKTKLSSVEYERPSKFGSGTIKPIAEFLSYRSWMNSGEQLVLGNFNKAGEYFAGGAPAAAAGEASKHLEKGSILSDVKGVHHKPTFVNGIGKIGGKIFGAPVAIVATAVDFYYTPPGQAKEAGDTRVVAPKERSSVRYK